MEEEELEEGKKEDEGEKIKGDERERRGKMCMPIKSVMLHC